MKGLRKILSHVKWFAINSLHIVRQRRFFDPVKHSGRKIIYVDLDSNPYDRYLMLLLFLFDINQYNVVFLCRYGFLGSWSTSLVISENKNAFFSFKKPTDAALTLTNIAGLQDDYDFLIDHNYFSSQPGAWYLPMPMVDSFYIFGIYKQAEKLQHNEARNLRIFFAGRFLKVHYNRSEVKDIFKMFTRYDLFQRVKHCFPSQLVTPTDLTLLKKDQPLVIVDRDVVNIEPHYLYEVLSKSAFFLSFPGVVMPLCHNVVEAMAFGCIPILQHYHHFHPSLEDGETCLAFTDEAGLKRVIDTALAMQPSQIARMRENVIRYYNEYLSPEAAIRNLFSARGNQKLLLVNAEYQSVDLLIQGARGTAGSKG